MIYLPVTQPNTSIFSHLLQTNLQKRKNSDRNNEPVPENVYVESSEPMEHNHDDDATKMSRTQSIKSAWSRTKSKFSRKNYKSEDIDSDYQAPEFDNDEDGGVSM